MDAITTSDFKRAMAQGNVNRYAEAYLGARLAEVQNQLVVANEQMYRQLQGRAQELQDLLKIIAQVRE
jgi:O-phosphoseryl-tRNA(Cys) synthetase